jgi:hypothetical protein
MTGVQTGGNDTRAHRTPTINRQNGSRRCLEWVDAVEKPETGPCHRGRADDALVADLKVKILRPYVECT